MASLTTSEEALDYSARLEDDIQRLQSADIPGGYTAAQWRDTVHVTASLDLQLVQQLIAGRRAALDAAPGAHGSFVVSSVDGSWQPIAVFVPRSYVKAHPAPLVVFLHGRMQTESSLVGLDLIRTLAEETGAIVVAPYGRGYEDFSDVAQSDIADAIDSVSHAYTVDRRYFAGYSMGGFSVFPLATVLPVKWNEILCIAGALLKHSASTVRAQLSAVPFYFVTGERDDVIPTSYGQNSAMYLDGAELQVSLYVEPTATHRLATMRRSMTSAWNDMLAGRSRGVPDAARAGGPVVSLPPVAPATSAKP